MLFIYDNWRKLQFFLKDTEAKSRLGIRTELDLTHHPLLLGASRQAHRCHGRTQVICGWSQIIMRRANCRIPCTHGLLTSMPGFLVDGA